MKPVRISTLAYAQRHIQPYVTNADWGNLSAIAGADKGTQGRVRITNAEIAEARSHGRARPLSERTVRSQTGRMVLEGRWLRREGWTYTVVGAAEHDLSRCEVARCRADLAELTRLVVQDELAERRRDKTRVKKARQRAARGGVGIA